MSEVYDAYNLLPVKAKQPAAAKSVSIAPAAKRKAKKPSKPEFYPAHPLADLFPMIEEAERIMLAGDIAAHGQHEPILLLEGMVLDGRNRQWACLHAGVKPVYAQFTGTDPLNFVLSKNLHRRHLTESQRALVAASIVDWERGVNQSTAGSANLPARRAAEKLSISERAVKAAKRVRDHGAPELIDAIRKGRVSIHAGEALSELQHAEQCKVLRQEEKQIVAKSKKIRAEKAKIRHAVKLTKLAYIAEKGRVTASGKIQRLYPVIYADPPWKYETRSEVTGGEKSAENHYPTMELEAICRLFDEIGTPATDDAILYMWVTTPMLFNAKMVVEAWGFEYKSSWVWDKVDIGTGHQGRDQHETLLICTRGKGLAPLMGTQPSTVYREKKGRHSAKPAYFAEQIERLYPDVPKLEMFCRSPRSGWDAWGYEAST